MEKHEIKNAIEAFMHPTVFTGVEPLLLVAEELATSQQLGDITEAVWVHWDEENEGTFSYISKFAVEGKITRRSYYDAKELEPFHDRLALPDKDNLEKTVLHRAAKQEIKDIHAKRSDLADEIHKGTEGLSEALAKGRELFLFKKRQGEWDDPFGNIDIDHPYEAVEQSGSSPEKPHYLLKEPKTGNLEEHTVDEEFYGYMVGSRAEIAGLQLKNESYKQKIEALEDNSRTIMKSIEWLDLTDSRLKAIKERLPRHPFDDYFKYVRKGEERKLQPPEKLVEALKIMIAKHMPDNKGPLGIEYIPIDNLLYLFHAIIPRADALRALEQCDVIHEPAGLLLGYEGKHKLPPKFLVALTHVAQAYEQFPAFIEACERYLAENGSGSE
jgi:hypothetical protein